MGGGCPVDLSGCWLLESILDLNNIAAISCLAKLRDNSKSTGHSKAQEHLVRF